MFRVWPVTASEEVHSEVWGRAERAAEASEHLTPKPSSGSHGAARAHVFEKNLWVTGTNPKMLNL